MRRMRIAAALAHAPSLDTPRTADHDID